MASSCVFHVGGLCYSRGVSDASPSAWVEWKPLFFQKGSCLQFVHSSHSETSSSPAVLRLSVKNAMQTLNIFDNTASAPVVRRNATQDRCAVCPRSKDKKSKTVCLFCNRFICAEHQNVLRAGCLPRWLDFFTKFLNSNFWNKLLLLFSVLDCEVHNQFWAILRAVKFWIIVYVYLHGHGFNAI